MNETLDPEARCTWAMDPDGMWHTLCGVNTEVGTDEFELCPFCNTLVEVATWEELLDELP